MASSTFSMWSINLLLIFNTICPTYCPNSKLFIIKIVSFTNWKGSFIIRLWANGDVAAALSNMNSSVTPPTGPGTFSGPRLTTPYLRGQRSLVPPSRFPVSASHTMGHTCARPRTIMDALPIITPYWCMVSYWGWRWIIYSLRTSSHDFKVLSKANLLSLFSFPVS